MATAVNGQRYPRAESGLLRGQKGNRLRHLLHCARPAQCVRGLGPLEECRVGLVVQPASPVDVRDNDAGIDRVDTDALRRQLQRDTSCDLWSQYNVLDPKRKRFPMKYFTLSYTFQADNCNFPEIKKGVFINSNETVPVT